LVSSILHLTPACPLEETNRAEDNVGYKVVAATVVALFLAFAAVIMRFIARRYQGMKTYWEDWFIYAGLVCKLGIDVGGIMCELAWSLLEVQR
jgi:hypothetical protein